MRDRIQIFSGNGNPELVREICAYLGLPIGRVEIRRFSNENLFVQIQENVRETDVFVVQPFSTPVHENIMELLIMMDALRSSSASRITAVIPYYSYARSDKKDAPRISIGGRLVADLMVTAGANRMLAMTLHAPQIHGFFSIPVDHLHALRELAAYFQRYDLSNTTVVAPDLGYAKEAAAFARILKLPVAAGAKQRFPDDRVVISSVIGDVDGRDVIILDDEIAKGSTVVELLERLKERDVRSARVACTHGLFAADALKRISSSPGVLEVVCTNTVPIPVEDRVPPLTVLSVAPALAEGMRRIHNGESVSALFDAT